MRKKETKRRACENTDKFDCADDQKADVQESLLWNHRCQIGRSRHQEMRFFFCPNMGAKHCVLMKESNESVIGC